MTRDEQISALMDGELDRREGSEVLDAIGRDPADAGRWERFHLISDVLHNELPDAVQTGLAERVRQALEDEPAGVAPGRLPAAWQRMGMRVGRQMAGLAVAASVTVAVVLVAWQPQPPDLATSPAGSLATERGQVAERGEGSQLARLAPGKNRTPVALDSRGGSRSSNPSTRDVQDGGAPLERYLVNHSEYSVSGGVQGMLPYMRVVGHSADNEVAGRDGLR